MLLVWSVIRQSVCLGLGFVIFHLVDDLRGEELRFYSSKVKALHFNINFDGEKTYSGTYIADFLAAFVSLILWGFQNRGELVLGPLILLPVLPLIQE